MAVDSINVSSVPAPEINRVVVQRPKRSCLCYLFPLCVSALPFWIQVENIPLIVRNKGDLIGDPRPN